MNAFLELRGKARLSAAAVAELLDIDLSRIASYERGELVPSPGMLEALRGLSLLRQLGNSAGSQGSRDQGAKGTDREEVVVRRHNKKSASERRKTSVEQRQASLTLEDTADLTVSHDVIDADHAHPSGAGAPRSGATAALSPHRGLSPIYLDTNEEKRRAVVLPRDRRRRIVFGWYGGKFNHLDWLLPLLPPAHHYCEPFAGSAAVLLNREPSAVETYNDVDGDVVNFFKTLREQPEELARAIALTPFSREEFHFAVLGSGIGIPPLERARRFYIRARQTRTGLAQTATLGRWANCKNTSRGGMSGVVSRWMGGIAALPEIGTRLLRVQIENRPALDVIRLYDSCKTFFYCDPPYLHDTRGDKKAYGFEMDEDEHIALAAALHRCKAKAALSGYRNRLMDRLYKGWRRFDAPLRQCHSIKKPRRECLWMNY